MQSTSTYPVYNKMDNRLGKEGYSDHKYGKEKVTVRRGRRRGPRRGRGCRMRGRSTLVETEEKQAAAGRTQSSVSKPYGKDGFMQLWQKAAVSLRMQSTDSERFSTAVAVENIQKAGAVEHASHCRWSQGAHAWER